MGKPSDYPKAFYQELAVFRPTPALLRINGLLSTVPVDLRELGRAGQDNPRLTAEAVRLSNSSLFNLARPVSSLEQAVVATNADTVRSLLLTCWLTRQSGSIVATRENQLFWSHSLLVAQISRRVSEATDLAQPEQAFLAGLLHDVGLLPVLSLFSRNKNEGLQEVVKDRCESIELQWRLLGTDHCELGRKLADEFELPLPLAEVVFKHHQSGPAVSSFPLLPIVGIAEAISQAHYLCAHQSQPTEAIAAYMHDSLEKWLPGLGAAAKRELLAALESNLFENAARFRPGTGNVWSDSLSRPPAQPEIPGAGR